MQAIAGAERGIVMRERLRQAANRDGMPSRRAVLGAGVGLGLSLGLGSAPAATRGVPGVTADGARLVTLHRDGRWCEGPAWDRATATLVFSDVRADRLLRLAQDGQAGILRDPSGFSNGNAFDSEGRLLTCEQLGRRVVRQERDGRLTVLADRYRGRRLNSPNDLVVARDGAVWFTDPTFGLMQPEEGRMAEPEQPGRYVFRLDPSGRLDVAADTFEQPNGIAFSPDGARLYVSDTSAAEDHEGTREIRAFDVVDGRLRRERFFASVPSGTPDGLATDAAGRLFAATDRGAGVWDRDGTPLGVVPTPVTCANLAFGGPDGRWLYLCAGTSVHRIETLTRGAEWA